MANDSLMFGAGGLVIGAILGMMSSGPNYDDLEKRLAEKIDAAAATSSASDEQIAALSEKLAALEAAVAAGTEQSNATGADVKGQIDGVVSALNDTIASSGAAQSEALKGAIVAQGELIQEALSGQTAALSAEIGSVGDGVTAIQDTMASHHGQMKGMGGGHHGSAAAADTPAEESAAAPTETAPAPTPAAVTPTPEPEPEPDGTAAGETVMLLDGAVRVFVSGVDEETQTARVAVNGLRTEILGTHVPVTFEADGKICELVLDNVTRGHVEMSPNCPE